MAAYSNGLRLGLHSDDFSLTDRIAMRVSPLEKNFEPVRHFFEPMQAIGKKCDRQQMKAINFFDNFVVRYIVLY